MFVLVETLRAQLHPNEAFQYHNIWDPPHLNLVGRRPRAQDRSSNNDRPIVCALLTSSATKSEVDTKAREARPISGRSLTEVPTIESTLGIMWKTSVIERSRLKPAI